MLSCLQIPIQTSREKFSSNGVLWFVIPLIQIHVDTFGPFQCFTRVYSGQFVAFLKSCQTQDKFPNFLRDLQDLQDSKNFQFFLLFLSFQPEKVINFTTNIFYVLKQCIFLNKSHKRQNKKFFVNPSLIFCENTSNFSQKKRVLK